MQYTVRPHPQPAPTHMCRYAAATTDKRLHEDQARANSQQQPMYNRGTHTHACLHLSMHTPHHGPYIHRTCSVLITGLESGSKYSRHALHSIISITGCTHQLLQQSLCTCFTRSHKCLTSLNLPYSPTATKADPLHSAQSFISSTPLVCNNNK
jgi:hypothetical protein